MKTLFFDCSMGAAGDMLTACLFELFDDTCQGKLIAELNSFGIPDVVFSAEKVSKCGISGTHMTVKINGGEEGEACSHEHHHHNNLHEIEEIINLLSVSDKVKEQAIEIYKLLADAESQVHGVPVTDIHFHEVGAMDAIADVVAFCYLMEKIGAKKVFASPVHVGSGQVKCAHGILPVPAPATALLLKGVPMYSGEIKGELCTPTGAALLRYFIDEFREMPTMKLEKIGYGMGKKDFPQANCIRAMLGEMDSFDDSIVELACNLDDMSGEKIGFAMEMLLEEGALDVYTVPIGMKKSRPGVMLCVLCSEENKQHLVETLFRHTTTLGIRESKMNRYKLTRRTEMVETPYGTVRKKVSEGYGVKREKLEYDDIAKIAKENNLTLDDLI